MACPQKPQLPAHLAQEPSDLPPNTHPLPRTGQLAALLTGLRNKETSRGAFVFYADRVNRLLVEEGALPVSLSRALVPAPRTQLDRSADLVSLVPLAGLNHLPVLEKCAQTSLSLKLPASWPTRLTLALLLPPSPHPQPSRPRQASPPFPLFSLAPCRASCLAQFRPVARRPRVQRRRVRGQDLRRVDHARRREHGGGSARVLPVRLRPRAHASSVGGAASPSSLPRVRVAEHLADLASHALPLAAPSG